MEAVKIGILGCGGIARSEQAYRSCKKSKE